MPKINSIGLMWENLEYGGMCSTIEDLLNSKIFRNVKVTFFTNTSNKTIRLLNDNLSNNNVKFVYYRSLNIFNSKNFFLKIGFFLLKPLLFILSIVQFFFILKKYRFDIFFAECGGYGGFRSEMASVIAGKLLNYPKIIMAIHHEYNSPKVWGNTIKLINFFIGKILSSLIFNSYAVKNNINKKAPLIKKIKKQIVIHLGVKKDVNHIDKINLKKKFFKKENKFNVAIISRIERAKGHMNLILAFNKLSQNMKKQFKFFFIGVDSDNTIAELKDKINFLGLNDYFLFTGYLKTDKGSIFKNLDLLVSLTTTFEGFGLSIAESMLYGVPVIATDVGAVSEFVNNKNGKLIKPNNEKEVIKALKSFANSNNQWKNRAKIAKKNIIKQFSVNKMANLYMNHFINIKSNDTKNN